MQVDLFSAEDIRATKKPELHIDSTMEIRSEKQYDPEDYIVLEPHRLRCTRCGKLSERSYLVRRGERKPRKICYRCREMDTEYIPKDEKIFRTGTVYELPKVTICKGPTQIFYDKESYMQASIAALRCKLLVEMGVIVVMGREAKEIPNF